MTLMYMYFTVITDAIAYSNAKFGAGTGSIFLDNLQCGGTENSLLNCTSDSVVRCYSGHNEDAGVRCQGKDNSLIDEFVIIINS